MCLLIKEWGKNERSHDRNFLERVGPLRGWLPLRLGLDGLPCAAAWVISFEDLCGPIEIGGDIAAGYRRQASLSPFQSHALDDLYSWSKKTEMKEGRIFWVEAKREKGNDGMKMHDRDKVVWLGGNIKKNNEVVSHGSINFQSKKSRK